MKYLQTFESHTYTPTFYVNYANKALIVDNVIYDFAMQRVGTVNETLAFGINEGIGSAISSAWDTAKGAAAWVGNAGWTVIKPPMGASLTTAAGVVEWGHYIAAICSLVLTLTGVGAAVASAIDLVDGSVYLLQGIVGKFVLNQPDFNPWINMAIGVVTVTFAFMGGKLTSGSLIKSMKSEMGIIGKKVGKAFTAEAAFNAFLGAGNRGKSIAKFIEAVENKSLLGKLKEAFTTFLNFVKEVPVVNKVLGLVKGFFTKLYSMLSSGLSKVADLLRSVKTGVKTGVKSLTTVTGSITGQAEKLAQNVLAKSIMGEDALKTVVNSLGKTTPTKNVSIFFSEVKRSGMNVAELKPLLSDATKAEAFFKNLSKLDADAVKLVAGACENPKLAAAFINADKDVLRRAAKLTPAEIKQLEAAVAKGADATTELSKMLNPSKIVTVTKLTDLLGDGAALTGELRQGFDHVKTFSDANGKATLSKYLKSKAFAGLSLTDKLDVKIYLNKEVLPKYVGRIEEMSFAEATRLFKQYPKGTLIYKGEQYTGNALVKLINLLGDKKAAKMTVRSLLGRRAGMSLKMNISDYSALLGTGELGSKNDAVTDAFFLDDATDIVDIGASARKRQGEGIRLIKEYFKNTDTSWKALLGTAVLDKQEKPLPTDAKAYEIEVNDSYDLPVVNAIKLYQALLNKYITESGATLAPLDVDGDLGSKTFSAMLYRLGKLGETDAAYKTLTQKAEVLKNALM